MNLVEFGGHGSIGKPDRTIGRLRAIESEGCVVQPEEKDIGMMRNKPNMSKRQVVLGNVTNKDK